jgi:hypothetical protein
MTSYSIYRAHSGEGIGEGPGKPAAGPDQYVWASPELWREQAVLDGLRPWMTLKFQSQIQYERKAFQEAWSCCVLYGFLFVTRLTLEAGDRYFSHARAWRVADLKLGSDPGALLGNSAAFDSPSDPFGASEAPESRMTWVDLLENPGHREMTVRFVSQLHAARMAGRPMIVVGERFHSSEVYFRALTFARAALPLELRRRCCTRVYTHETTQFLENLKAGLVVVPREGIDGVIAAHPEVTVLASDGGRYHGPKVDEGYGQMVVARAVKFPGALFAYADRCEPGMPVHVAKAAYHLASASGDAELMDDLLENVLHGRISPEILLPEEWTQFGADVLQRLALKVDGLGWHERILTEVRRRSLVLDPVLDGASPALALRFFEVGLVSGPAARRRLSKCDAQEIFELLRVGSGVAERLAMLLGDAPLPEDWVTHLPLLGSSSQAVQRLIGAANVLALVGSSWDALLYTALVRLLRDGMPSEGLVEQLAQLPMPPSIDVRLLIVEILYRGKAEVARPRIEQILKASDRGVRRAVVEKLDDPAYGCLTDAKIPPEWDGDVWDLLLRLSDARLRQLAPARLVKLLELDQSMPRRVIGILDEHLARETGDLEKLLAQQKAPAVTAVSMCLATTAALISFEQWMHWRTSSTTPRGTLRSCAKAWVLVAQGVEVGFENWKQAVLDLERLDAEEIRQMRVLCEPEPFRWPVVPGFEQEQLDDLIALAGGVPSTLALIASTTRADYSYVQRRANLNGPADLLKQLESSDPLPPQWNLEEVRTFLTHSQSGVAKSRAAAAVLRFLAKDPRAVGMATEFQLWDEKQFLWGLFNVLFRKEIEAPSANALERIIGTIPPAPRSNADPGELRQLESAYSQKGYPRIGAWLYLEKMPQFHQDAVRAMVTRNPGHAVWSQIAEIVQRQPTADPVGDLLEHVWRMPREKQDELDKFGAWVFRDACSTHPVLAYASHHGRVPALELAAFLQRFDSIGKVAASLVSIGVPRAPNPEAYWMAFLDTLETCRRRAGLPQPDRPVDEIGLILRRQERWGTDRGMTEALFRVLKEKPRGRSLPNAGSLASGKSEKGAKVGG